MMDGDFELDEDDGPWDDVEFEAAIGELVDLVGIGQVGDEFDVDSVVEEFIDWYMNETDY